MIDDSLALLHARFAELGIEPETPADLLNKAKEIVMRHKELQAQSSDLQNHVNKKTIFIFKKLNSYNRSL